MKHLVVTGALLLSLVSGAWAATYNCTPTTPGGIQGVIDLASPGDTILLANGTYEGDGNRDLNFHGKAITLRSQSGNPAACIIYCGESPHRGFMFETGEGPDSRVEDLTIDHGRGDAFS